MNSVTSIPLTNPTLQTLNTTISDLPYVLSLFEQAMQLQGKNGYRVWDNIDRAALEKDIENKLQFKIVNGDAILCIFSIQFNDPFIWRERDKDKAIYLHRIVVNPNYKGLKMFDKVLSWAKTYAHQHQLDFIRMDTWAENERIINYYKSFDFSFIENYKTPDVAELPLQNRNLNVALLELKVTTT